MEGQRKIWIDWAKTLSIFAIVWGHCFPEGLCGFIYAFNVPVFFIISGYLCHREASFGKCFDKTLHNLIIPYFILAAIKVAGPVIKHIGDGEWIWSVAAVLGGFHSLNDAPGCSNLWFVYSLVIVKLLFQVSSGKRDIALAMACLAGAVVYNDILHLEWRWAVSNCLLAYPFFIIGNSLRDKDILQRLVTSARQYRYVAALAAALLIAVTYIVGTQNGQAKLYMGQYANNIVLFAVGALTGSMAVFCIVGIARRRQAKDNTRYFKRNNSDTGVSSRTASSSSEGNRQNRHLVAAYRQHTRVCKCSNRGDGVLSYYSTRKALHTYSPGKKKNVKEGQQINIVIR